MVNIDAVYQKVLALANKEQRGYITPQEFNLFADQAQMEIFEQYFYDKNQFARMPGNSYAYSDVVTNLEEKIAIFEKYSLAAGVSSSFGDIDMSTFTDLYRLGSVRVNYIDEHGLVVAEQIQLNELNKYEKSLAKWSKKYPVYTRYNNNPQTFGRIKIYPYPDENTDQVKISYTRTPLKPVWGYLIVNDKPLYNADYSVNFELHASEQSELIYRILALVGITIQKPELTQIAAGLESAKVQQEKQ